MKKNYIFILVILTVFNFSSCTSMAETTNTNKPLLDIQIDELSKQFVETLSSENKSTLAIMDFVELDGSQTMFGKYLREELTIRIFRTDKVSVVERGMLEEVMKEWDFGANGYVNERTASKIGQLLGVEAITIGTITDLGDYLKVNARIIEVETGKLISVASVYLTKDNTVLTLIDKKIKEPVEIKKEELISPVKIILPKKEPAKQKLSFVRQGVKFDIDKAEFSSSNNKLILTGSATAQETDKIFSYRPRYIQLISDNGNTYDGDHMTVGLTETGYGNKKVDLIEGVPVFMKIEFADFESVPKKILRLQVERLWSVKNIGDIEFSFKPNMLIELIN